MNDRDFVSTVEKTAERLTRIAAWVQTPGRDDHRTPIQRNRDGWHGHPKAAAYDRSSSGSSRDGIEDNDPDLGWRRTTSDPTADAAIRPDRAAASRRKVERDLRAAANIVANLERELVHWGEPRPATDYERRLVEQGNVKPEPGCVSCAKHTTANGTPRWSMQSRTVTVNGDKVRVCGTCHEWHTLTGELPPAEFLDALDRNDQATTRRLRSDAMRRAGAA